MNSPNTLCPAPAHPWLLQLTNSKRAAALLAMLVTAAMAAVDFWMQKPIFLDANMPDSAVVPMALVYCLALDGLAYFLGRTVAKLRDPSQYRSGQKGALWIIFGVCAFGLVLAFGMLIFIRFAMLQKSGGIAAFLNNSFDDTEGSFLGQLLLMVLPILSSLFAFVVSASFDTRSAADEAEDEAAIMRNRWLRAKVAYEKAENAVHAAAQDLWNRVSTSNQTLQSVLGKQPDYTRFYDEVAMRLRNMAVADSIQDTETLFYRFQNAIEAELKRELQQMACKSTLPLDIRAIDLTEVVAEYDSHQPPAARWNANDGLEAATKTIKLEADNTVLVRQTAMGYHTS